jgi:hypothetical protein
MVPPYKVVLEFDNALNVVRVVLLKKKQKLGFNGRLVIIFFLILNQFDGYICVCLVIVAFDHLTECSLADEFDDAEAVGDLVSSHDSVVSFLIIKSVIN